MKKKSSRPTSKQTRSASRHDKARYQSGNKGKIAPAAPLPESPSAGRYWVWVLIGSYLITRLPGLAAPGLQYDEATYLYWGQVIGVDWGQRFIGAGWGGKQPLHAWLVALFEKLLSDPVFAGRLVSVVSGALTLVAIWLLARRLFSLRVAILAAFLYILCPFTLFYDRLAMIDSLLAAEALWIIYFSVRLLDRQEVLSVAGLGLAFATALLTKSVGVAFLLLLPASLLVVERSELTRERIVRWLAAMLIGLIAGGAVYYIAFGASEGPQLVAQFEAQYGKYVMPLSDLLALPWAKWGTNVGMVIGWFQRLMTVPLSVAAVAALLTLPWLGRRAWLLGSWVILPIVGQILTAAVFYERYILFSIPALLILIARLFEWAYEKLVSWDPIARRVIFRRPAASIVGIIGLMLILLPMIVWDVVFLTDLPAANQLVGGFYGLQALRADLTERAKVKPIYVLVNYSPAPVEDGTAVLLRDVPQVTVLRVAPVNGKLVVLDPLTHQIYSREYFAGREVYYAWGPQAETSSWLAGHVELDQTYPNLRADDTYVGLYKVRFDEAFQ